MKLYRVVVDVEQKNNASIARNPENIKNKEVVAMERKGAFLFIKDKIFKQCIKDKRLFFNALNNAAFINPLMNAIRNDPEITNKPTLIYVNDYTNPKNNEIEDIFINAHNNNGEILHVTLHFAEIENELLTETGAFHAKAGQHKKAPKLRFIFNYRRSNYHPYLHIVSEPDQESQYPKETQEIVKKRTFNTLDDESDRKLAITIMNHINTILPAHVIRREVNQKSWEKCVTTVNVKGEPAPQAKKEDKKNNTSITYAIPEKQYSETEKELIKIFEGFIMKLSIFRKEAGLPTPFVGDIKDMFLTDFGEDNKKKILKSSTFANINEYNSLLGAYHNFKSKINQSNYVINDLLALFEESMNKMIKKKIILAYKEKNVTNSSNNSNSTISTIKASYTQGSDSQGSNSQRSPISMGRVSPANEITTTTTTTNQLTILEIIENRKEELYKSLRSEITSRSIQQKSQDYKTINRFIILYTNYIDQTLNVGLPILDSMSTIENFLSINGLQEIQNEISTNLAELNPISIRLYNLRSKQAGTRQKKAEAYIDEMIESYKNLDILVTQYAEQLNKSKSNMNVVNDVLKKYSLLSLNTLKELNKVKLEITQAQGFLDGYTLLYNDTHKIKIKDINDCSEIIAEQQMLAQRINTWRTVLEEQWQIKNEEFRREKMPQYFDRAYITEIPEESPEACFVNVVPSLKPKNKTNKFGGRRRKTRKIKRT